MTPYLGAVAREAVVSARSQLLASLLTVGVVAAMCAAVVLTAGRTVATEQAALAAIDAAGTRTVTVRAAPNAGLTTAIIDQLHAVSAVTSVAGLGPIIDVRNAKLPAGTTVALRTGYGDIAPVATGEPNNANTGDRQPIAIASDAATAELGLWQGVGGLITEHDDTLAVRAGLTLDSHLEFLEPLMLLAPTTDAAPAPLTVLVVEADDPANVEVVTTIVAGLLNDLDPAEVTIETSRDLAAIRAAVRGELDRYGRGTVLVIQAITAALVAVNLLVLVTMRRKDDGRRRALGARRSTLITMLLTQTTLLALAGAAIGTAASLATLIASNASPPHPPFALAVATTAIITAIMAALPPAIIAARRDPLHELRVP